MLLAKMETEIIAVGSIAGSLHPKFSHRSRLGISVLKSYWGQGIATVMMEEMLDWVSGILNAQLVSNLRS